MPARPTIETRFAQMFPALEPTEIERLQATAHALLGRAVDAQRPPDLP